ncbi:MAG: sugar ABC transporter permease [Phycisphaerae bacterium]|nr:sugar ABC transporter permease [Phycisphaerae bacterium]
MVRPVSGASPSLSARLGLDDERRGAYGFVLPALLLFGMFILAPTAGTFVLSLFEWSGGGEPEYVGLRNYRIAFTGDAIFVKSLENNVIYMFATLVFEVGAGLVLALMLDLKRRGYELFRVVIFTPMTLSLTVIGLMWYFILHPAFGLLPRSPLAHEDTALYALCVVSGWTYCGFYMVLFYAALQGIPRELYEAAMIDGAGELRRILHVSLPLLRETTLVSVLICVTGAFKAYDLFRVMAPDGVPHHSTEIVSTWLVRSAFSAEAAQMGYGAALAAIMTVLVLALTLAYMLIVRRAQSREVG